MRKIYLFLPLLFLQINSFAQTISNVGKICLSVVMPMEVNGLDGAQLSKLESKIIQIASSSGIAAIGYSNNFVIYPKFDIYDTNIVEGGMQNITISTVDFSLYIKQVDNNMLFSSISKSIKGSGRDKSSSVTNAISNINTKDLIFQQFVANGKTKIVRYFENKCSEILDKAEILGQKNEFEQSLSLLMSVPEEVSCYTTIQKKALEVYKAYQNRQCKIKLHEANTNIAIGDYAAGLESLQEIDPSVTCFRDAQALINRVAGKVSAEKRKEYETRMKIYNDQVALQKLRITSVKEVALAYYNSKPSTVQYSYIIR